MDGFRRRCYVLPLIPATFYQLGRREAAQDRQRLILDLVPQMDGTRQSPSWGALSSVPGVTNLKQFPSFYLGSEIG